MTTTAPASTFHRRPRDHGRRHVHSQYERPAGRFRNVDRFGHEGRARLGRPRPVTQLRVSELLRRDANGHVLPRRRPFGLSRPADVSAQRDREVPPRRLHRAHQSEPRVHDVHVEANGVRQRSDVPGLHGQRRRLDHRDLLLGSPKRAALHRGCRPHVDVLGDRLERNRRNAHVSQRPGCVEP
jgi:hypothetical protein